MRNSATYGMNWKQRQEYRNKRKQQIAKDKDSKTETLNRLMDTVIAIEDAFKPEADRLHAHVIASWVKAHAYVMENGKTFEAVRTAYTGYDLEANPLPMYRGMKYVQGDEICTGG